MASEFEALTQAVRPHLERAFVAAFGPQRGEEALAEAMSYAWEHLAELNRMANPAGYLYRVGQSRSKVRPTLLPRFPPTHEVGLPLVEPRLPYALAQLTERQRVCVALIHAYEYTYQEVADILGISRSSVQSHADRGLDALRQTIGATV